MDLFNIQLKWLSKSSHIGQWFAPLKHFGSRWFAQGHLNTSWGIHFTHPYLTFVRGFKDLQHLDMFVLLTIVFACVSFIMTDKIVYLMIFKVVYETENDPEVGLKLWYFT